MHNYLTILIFILFFQGCDMKSSEAYFLDAEKLEERGNYKDAISALDKAISKDKNFIGAYINRGADKSELKDYKGAIEDYMAVVSMDSKNTVALYNIGNNYQRLKNYDLAVAYYDKAFAAKGGETIYLDFTPNSFVDLDKFDVPGYEISYQRAIAFYQIGRLDEAFAGFCIL